MRILIVGGTSALGSALGKVLSDFSEVITAGRHNCDLFLDLNDPVEKISLPVNIDAVIHTAAHFGGTEDSEILEAERTNVLGTLKLCQTANRAKAKHLVFISSIFSSLNAKSGNYNIYSISKKHAEELAEFYCTNHFMPLTILKPSQIYGQGDAFRKHQPFFYTLLDKAERGEDITLYGSNDPRRNYIHIDDLTQIITKVVQQRAVGTYSCANTSHVSYKQIAEAAFLAFNTKGNVYFDTGKSDIPDNIFEIDNSLYEKIGFYPQISIEEGIKKLLNERVS